MEIQFEQKFSKKILERGYGYYLEGAVTNLKIHNGDIHALVSGSKYYEVNIHTKDGTIDYMHCTCPYAQDSTCKHQAAVLYAVTKEVQGQETTPLKDGDEQILKKIKKEELEAFVLEKLASDHTFRMEFESNFSQYYPLSIDNYVNEWRCILHQSMGRHHYVDYDQVYEFEHKVTQLIYKLNNVVSVYPLDVFSICTTIYEELVDLSIDDSYNTTGIIAESLQDIMCSCIHNGDAYVIDVIASWINQATCNEDFYNYGLTEGLTDLYMETLPLQERIDYLKDHLSKTHQVEKLISLLVENKESERTIYQELTPYIHISVASQWIIDYNLRHNHIDEAIQILKDIIETKKTFCNYSDMLQLIHIYEQYQYYEEYHRNVRQYLKEYSFQAFELYKEYKTHFQLDEWDLVKREIIENFASKKLKADAYFEEDMKEELISFLETIDFSITELFQFEEILKEDYEEKMLNIYVRKIDCLCERASNTNYDDIYHILLHMLTLPNGTLVVKKVTLELMKNYKRRINLMGLLKTLPISF